MPDPSPHFVRLDRDGGGAAGRHFVIHAADPRFALELQEDTTAPDGMGQGVIRRLCVPNSWAGDYGRYARMLTKAQEFFARTGQKRHGR